MTEKASRKKRAKPALKLQASPLEATRFDICGVQKEFRQVPIVSMRPGMYQSRRYFNPKRMKELSASLKATGMNFSPLIIRPVKQGTGYEIICGERRWRSAQAIGLETLLCCVGNFTDEQALYLSGADNIQREDLNALEEAQSYELMMLTGLNHQQVADEIGRSRGHVSNYLRLLKLPLIVRDLISRDELTFAHVRPLCSLAYSGQQIKIAKEALIKKWSAQRVEAEVATLLKPKKRPDAKERISEDTNIKRLMEMVSEQTGYPCVIVKTERGGWQLGLGASCAEEFQGILDRLGVNTESA
ncbi:ParB/RepB/Spo0J family partition protein [Pseudomonas tritici]|uniref:ParB/RepB/Spo0J family partition protein n=1 Tax=Pseudomonas tritici TaxID=2745518 RepID=UPI00387AB15E